MKTPLLYFLILLMLSACQTTISDNDKFPAGARAADTKLIKQEQDSINCLNSEQQRKIKTLNYLVAVNRLIDEMIAAQAIQQRLLNKRLKIHIQTVFYEQAVSEKLKNSIDLAIKNRINRSGKFLLVDDKQASDVQLVSQLKNRQSYDKCEPLRPEQMLMYLRNSLDNQKIWTAKKDI